MPTLNILDYGASPANADNTDNIQRALDAAKPGDTVRVPADPKPFMVDALRSLRPHSDTLLMVDGSLKSLPNGEDHSQIVVLDGVSNVTVAGTGALLGDRTVHDEAPELSHAFGVAVFRSKIVTVSMLRIAGCAGDGVYLQDNTDVVVRAITSTGHKRNGISVISGANYQITDNVLSFMHGPAPLPACGMDIEPDTAAQGLVNIQVMRNQLIKNKGAGIYAAFSAAANRHNIHVINNVFDQHYKDGSGPPMGGINTPWCNFFYATCRTLPGYDYWLWPTSYEIA